MGNALAPILLGEYAPSPCVAGAEVLSKRIVTCGLKEEKERGEVRGDREESEGRRRGILTTGEWYNQVSNMFHHM